MTPQMALDLCYLAIMTAVKLSAPILLTSIVAGVAINIFQTVTSIRDPSLTFVPKAAAAVVVMALSLPWGIQVITSYFRTMYSMFGQVTP
jgi:flagellar biosynthetic protein FliQ